jgi:hypothetical protein
MATTYDPATLPDLYAARGEGSCMEPEFSDGACLAFDRTAAAQPGDYVVIWFRPGLTPPGGPQHWFKRLVMPPPPGTSFPVDEQTASELEPVIIVEQLNPPKLYSINCSSILALHRCIGEAERMEGGRVAVRREQLVSS